MPLYEYQCQACRAVFEVRATFKEKEDGLHPECPQCQSLETRQVLTAGLLIHVVGGPGPAAPACGPNCGPGCCGG